MIVLPLRNQTALDNFLKELYNPSSPSYRQFLTVEEFTTEFGPTQQDYALSCVGRKATASRWTALPAIA